MSTALRLTVDQYDQMVDRGAFDHLSGKVELIQGEISFMSPPGPGHDWLIELLTNWSVRNTREDEVSVRVQSALSLPEQDSRPQPDILWVRRQSYREQHPEAADVLLLMEVSHSSLSTDRNKKQQLYAAAGIPEYWIVNVEDREIYVFQDPDTAAQQYRSLKTIDGDTTICPQCAEDAVLQLELLFA